ncbi:MAG TPA: methyltransferase domain-containing protein [Rhizomicrobium sp.]|jgi:predicted methyltransferase
MKRAILAAAVLGFAFAAAPVAAKTPAYISAAVADKNRPDADTARDADRKPAEMMEFAGIKPGMKVVDVIPGKGYFSRLFAAAVGPKGWVYGFEPTEFDAAFAKRSIPVPTGGDPKYPNFNFIHQSITKFQLPEPVDVVWTSQNYHDLHDKFTGPVDLAVANKAIYDALKPGGYYVILDHAAEKGSGLRDTDTLHRIDPEVVKKEVEAAGFKFAGESKVLRNPQDPHTALVFDKSIRGHTDQFIYKFQKPKK